MEVAEKILTVGGVLLLTYAFFTGFLLSRARDRSPVGPKYLILAHTEPLMQGAMLLGLVWAVRLSSLDGRVEAVAAALLVVAASIQGGKELLNWRQGIEDEFAHQPRPLGYYAARVQSPMASVGLIILVVGVLLGL
ncbi:MAG: hypothetical protein GEU80_07390 [Dehalococcoidia bacterium]|nr:hypothetical protein [Dehalococcoidia bacterium]